MTARRHFPLVMLCVFAAGLSVVLTQAAFGAGSSTSTAAPTPSPRPKVGLVLSGGGARGAAHIGVIKVLEEMRVPIDLIVGTSMGALIGASYASGTSIEELEKRLIAADWNDLLTDASPREDRSFLRKEEDQARLLRLEMGVKGLGVQLPKGAVSGQKLDILFSAITSRAGGEQQFDRLAIPFRAIATDAETGRMHVFTRGRLPSVMRASMSVPGAVAPVEIGSQLFLDGGLTRNLPVDIAREMGADIVIAVNIGAPLLKRSEIQNVLGVSLQMINILTEQNVRASLDSLRERDVLISPQLDTIGSADFNRATEAMTIGAEATRALKVQLSRLALTEASFQEHRILQLSRAQQAVSPADRISSIKVVGLDRANESELLKALGVQPGDSADFQRINAGISRVFGMGYFERVNYSLLDERGTPNSRRLVIDAREKSWGPHYLRVGLSMAADSIGEGRFNVLVRSQQTQVNAAGAEWRNDLQFGRDQRFASRFFQPFGAASMVNVSPGVEFAKHPIDIYSGPRRVAQYEITSSSAGFDLGVDISRNAIARIGLVRGDDRTGINIGVPFVGEGHERKGGARFRAQYDSLDSLDFPRIGRTLSLDYYANLNSLGATRSYRKFEANYADHASFGRHTFAIAARYGQNRGDLLPVFDQFSLGGFLQLSGYRPGELIGQSVAFTRLSYSQRLNVTPSFLGSNYYAGVSAELGRVSNSFLSLASSNNRHSFGVFLGIESAFGPLYLGYGRAQDRSPVFYLFLGQP